MCAEIISLCENAHLNMTNTPNSKTYTHKTYINNFFNTSTLIFMIFNWNSVTKNNHIIVNYGILNIYSTGILVLNVNMYRKNVY